ncbi:MAG: hypothetical protein ACI4S4_07180 [Candidatus Ornithospirochaeta sp.]
MIQSYVLSIVYLVLSALMFIQNRYRLMLSPVLRFSTFLMEKRRALNIFTLIGLLLALTLLFFPLSPGPMFLGDLIPSLMILYESLYFMVVYGKSEKDRSKDYLDMKKEGRRQTLGWISILVAVLHFVFPAFVLL